MKKRVVSIALLSTIVLSTAATPTVVFADDFDTQIENKNNEIANIKSQEAAAQAQVDQVQGQIDSITSKIADLKAQNEKLEAANKVLQAEVMNLNERIIERNKTLDNQARNIQTNGTGTNLLDVVLNAESISDAIARVQAMTTLTSANKNLMNEQKKDLEALQEKVAENAKQTKIVWDNKAALEQQENDLKTQQAQLNAAQIGLAATRATTEEERDALLGQQKEAQEEAAAIAAQQEAEARAKAEAEAKAREDLNNQVQEDTSIPDTGSDNTVSTPQPSLPSPAPGGNGSSANNPYPAGQCTAYVWQWFADQGKIIPTFRGNAGDWIAYANSGAAPGTIAVFTGGYYGHVAVVISVNGSEMTIAEGNFNGIWGNVRTISISEASGFIAV